MTELRSRLLAGSYLLLVLCLLLVSANNDNNDHNINILKPASSLNSPPVVIDKSSSNRQNSLIDNLEQKISSDFITLINEDPQHKDQVSQINNSINHDINHNPSISNSTIENNHPSISKAKHTKHYPDFSPSSIIGINSTNTKTKNSKSKNNNNQISTFTSRFYSKILARLGQPIKYLKVDPVNRKRLAFVEENTGLLKVIDLSTLLITTIDGPGIDNAFFWSPDGVRIIYRKQVIVKERIVANLQAFDYRLRKNIEISTIQGVSGFPTFDPRDYRIVLMHEQGVLQKRLKLPKSNLARWELKKVERSGNFTVTPKGVILISPSGKGMIKLKDDGSGIQSYRISPKGNYIAWSTKNHNLYYSDDIWQMSKASPTRLDFGVDPVWVSDNNHIIYSGVRRIANKIAGYDLKLTNLSKDQTWLTKTYGTQERWPVILTKNTIIYTVSKTTDIFGLFPITNSLQAQHLAISNYPKTIEKKHPKSVIINDNYAKNYKKDRDHIEDIVLSAELIDEDNN